MAAEVSAAEGAIKRGAEAVSAARQELTGELRSLEGKLSGVGSMWRGQGAVAFTSLMTRWQGDATKIISALDEFEAKLTSAQSQYTATDEAQQATFAKFSGLLGG